MKNTSRSKNRKALKPRAVVAHALPQVQGGALDLGASDDLVGKHGAQHNETLVRDDRGDR